MIPYGRQDVRKEDIDSVVEVLRSEFLTQGPQVPIFEENIAQFVNTDHAIAVNSATSALHITYLAMGLGHGDGLWTTPITFLATANAAKYCGATVEFVDVESTTGLMSVEDLQTKLVEAEKKGKLPKIVVPVHLAGQSCDMKEIHKLSRQYGFKVVEDAAHAIGAKYNDKQVGSCEYSDACVFSFHPVKIITTGEGGVITTNNEQLSEKLKLLRSHGVTRDSSLFKHDSHGPWYYEQIALGYNYRMTDMQAALGTSQMRRLSEYVTRRNAIAEKYARKFESLPISVLDQKKYGRSSYHLFVIQLNLEKIGKTHRQVFENLRAEGVGVNLHYIPVYKQPYYADEINWANKCPNSEAYYSKSISLPMYPAMTDEEVCIVEEKVEKVVVE